MINFQLINKLNFNTYAIFLSFFLFNFGIYSYLDGMRNCGINIIVYTIIHLLEQLKIPIPFILFLLLENLLWKKKYKYFDISKYPTLITLFITFFLPGFWLGQVIGYLRWLHKGILWRIKLDIYHHNIHETFIKLFIVLSLIYSNNFLIIYSYIVACNITYFMCIIPNHDTLDTHLNVVYDTKNIDWGELQVRNSNQ